MDEADVEQLSVRCGLDLDSAAALLAAADGDIDTALAIHVGYNGGDLQDCLGEGRLEDLASSEAAKRARPEDLESARAQKAGEETEWDAEDSRGLYFAGLEARGGKALRERIAALSSSVSCFVFVRHSMTSKATDASQAADLARVLTEEGRAKCDAAGKWFRPLAPTLALVSPTGRTQDTLRDMCGGLHGQVDISIVQNVYNWAASTVPAFRAASDKLHYASLQAYLDDVEDGIPELYAEFATGAVGEMVPVLEEKAEAGKLSGNVIVVGHAIDQSAIALEFARALGATEEGLQIILEVVQDTASAIMVTADGTVSYVETQFSE